MSLFPANYVVGGNAEALEWSDLEVILQICRHGSLSGAARSLGVNHSTVFRRINNIEKKTGVHFFNRLPDGYAMTEAGQTAMQYAERIEAQFHALGREVLGLDARLQGNITLTAMEGFAASIAPGLILDFCKQHPGVTIEVIANISALNLNRREADIAIRATKKPPDTSLGRKICDFNFAVYASPDYIAEKSGLALAELDWCFVAGTQDWFVPMLWKKKEQLKEREVYSSNLSSSVLSAVACGLGATVMSCYHADLDPRLVRVTDPIPSLRLELWVLTHTDLRHTARVQALMKYLYESMQKDVDLYEGKRGRIKQGGVVSF